MKVIQLSQAQLQENFKGSHSSNRWRKTHEHISLPCLASPREPEPTERPTHLWVRMPVCGRLQGTERRCQGWGTHEADTIATNALVSHSDSAKPNSQPSKEAYVIAQHREMRVELHILFLGRGGLWSTPSLRRETNTPFPAGGIIFPKEATCPPG